jgi:hypothetical protein
MGMTLNVNACYPLLNSSQCCYRCNCFGSLPFTVQVPVPVHHIGRQEVGELSVLFLCLALSYVSLCPATTPSLISPLRIAVTSLRHLRLLPRVRQCIVTVGIKQMGPVFVSSCVKGNRG